MKRLTILSLGLGLFFPMLHNTSIHGMEQEIKTWVQSNNLKVFRQKLAKLSNMTIPLPSRTYPGLQLLFHEMVENKLSQVNQIKKYLKKQQENPGFLSNAFDILNPLVSDDVKEQEKKIYESKIHMINNTEALLCKLVEKTEPSGLECDIISQNLIF